MQGPPDNPGVNVRALEKLFTDIQTERVDTWNYTIRLSLLEIYVCVHDSPLLRSFPVKNIY